MHQLIGKQIGAGGSADIFECQDANKIIKLAKEHVDRHAVVTEYKNNQRAWDLGLSVAQPFEFIEMNGRYGIVLERIYGETLMDRYMKSVSNLSSEASLLELENGARLTARILYQIHCEENISHFPSQRDRIKHAIHHADYLNNKEKEAVISLFDQLPLKQQLTHGDPNPGNIFMRNNEVVVIDWMDAGIGNPESDLAEYIVMIRYAILPPHVPDEAVKFFNSIREQIIDAFMDEYTSLSDMTEVDVDAWIVPMMARKLFITGISDEEKQILLKEIRQKL